MDLSSLQKVEETMMTKADGQRIIDHIDAFAQRVETFDSTFFLKSLNEGAVPSISLFREGTEKLSPTIIA